MEFEFIENASMMAGGGAGISAAQTIVDKGVGAVLTGNCGPNAYQVLEAAGIKVITGVSGTVRQAAEDFKSGKFKAASQPNVDAHHGMGGGGAGSGQGSQGAAASKMSPEDEIEALKEQTEVMKKQIDTIQRRIEELRGKQG
jgi:predicted Fe-Mo cluster-binding NifX family protein